MSTWAEVDAFRAAAPAKPFGEWRAFAKLASGEYRFRARAGSHHVRVERPCYYVPGKWRAAWRGEMSRLLGGCPLVGGAMLSLRQVEAVLVAFDAWQEAGAPRMSRPTVIP